MRPRELEYREWGARLFRRALRDRIPISGSMSLTHRCNLECMHCYLGGSRGGSELSTDDWRELVDQLVQAGCLWLTMTGGEPLLRPDFEDIYLYARARGFLVTLFTNGTLVDDSLIDLFHRYPPHSVEISLYGFSAGTYGRVTGVPDARDAAYCAAERLAGMGVPVELKTVALRQNAHEIEAMRRYAEEIGARFRFDTLVTPCLDGSAHDCCCGLGVKSTLDLDKGDGKRRAAWISNLAEDQRVARKSLFSCGAGMTSFHVNPDGMLALCVSDVPLCDLTEGHFIEAWNGPVRERRELPLPHSHPCQGCRDQAFCCVCPPVARMETGSDLGVPGKYCDLGRRRLMEFRSIADAPDGGLG